MSKFCTYCDNLLLSDFTNEQLVFRCESCKVAFQPNDEDTLLYERIKEADVMIYEKILNKAVDDPATAGTRMKCINDSCDSTIVKQVRVELRLYNICVNCRSRWAN